MDDVILNQPKPFACDLCSKSYQTRAGLGGHKWAEHGIRGTSVAAKHQQKVKDGVHQPKASFTCDLCGHTFAVRNSLLAHKRKKHGVNTPRVYPQTGKHSAWFKLTKAERRRRLDRAAELRRESRARLKPTTPEENHAITRVTRGVKNEAEQHQEAIGISLEVRHTAASRQADSATSIALGRCQELCRNLAYEFQLPEKLFAARVAELFHASTLR